MEKYALTEHLNYVYYLRRGQPSFAYANFVAAKLLGHSNTTRRSGYHNIIIILPYEYTHVHSKLVIVFSTRLCKTPDTCTHCKSTALALLYTADSLVV